MEDATLDAELQTILHIQGLDRDGKTGLVQLWQMGNVDGCVDFTCRRHVGRNKVQV